MGKAAYGVTPAKMYGVVMAKAYGIDLSVGSLYQQWSGYPDSPDMTNIYPYQFVDTVNNSLYMSDNKFYTNTSFTRVYFSGTAGKQFNLSGGVWIFSGYWTVGYKNFYANISDIVTQRNTPIYTNSSFTVIYLDANM